MTWVLYAPVMKYHITCIGRNMDASTGRLRLRRKRKVLQQEFEEEKRIIEDFKQRRFEKYLK
ncbi:MAG: hypothetical protein N3F08_01425 [Crenarchaeota archaeon]|nr:hypothetical protein [Thermoproteota archaeon]